MSAFTCMKKAKQLYYRFYYLFLAAVNKCVSGIIFQIHFYQKGMNEIKTITHSSWVVALYFLPTGHNPA